MQRFTGLLGLVVILAVAWLFSAHKRAIKLRIVLWGVGLQVAFALLVLKTDFGKVFQAIGAGVNAMLNYAEAGSNFVFGPLGIKTGPFGVVFAFQVLPIIIFIASFFSILYYLGVMQWVVKGMAIVMQKVMGASGAESLNVAASIFMGQTEAPLTIKPFIAGMTQSELFTIMTSGMAHVSGAVMAAYVKIAGVEHRAPADGRHHDRARHHHAGQDLLSGSGQSGHRGQSGSQNRKDRRERDRRRRAGRGRRPAPGAEHRRHADRVSGADRHGERHSGMGPHAARMGWLPASCSRSSAWFSPRWPG